PCARPAVGCRWRPSALYRACLAQAVANRMQQMFPFLRAGPRAPTTLPLFPLKTVLFPGRLLPLKVFEQRYIDMTKACLKDERPFGVCLLTRGEEVAQRDQAAAG